MQALRISSLRRISVSARVVATRAFSSARERSSPLKWIGAGERGHWQNSRLAVGAGMLLPAAATAAAMQYNEGPAAADTVTIELPGGVTVAVTSTTPVQTTLESFLEYASQYPLAVDMISGLQNLGPQALDLTDPNHELALRAAADVLMKKYTTRKELEDLRATLVARKDDFSFFTHLSVILALSKTIISEIRKPFQYTMTFAVYGEVNRLKPKSEHENGEDFLRTKIAQLDWLFEANPLGSWDIIVVDDGCPKDSGGECKKVLEAMDYKKGNVQIAYLQDGINKKLPVVTEGTPIKTTRDSRKGGAIHYGLHLATEKSYPGKEHIVCYTDADLSTHLGQSGLMLDVTMNKGMDCAVGSRREKNAIMVKSGSRNVRGKVQAYLWKQMMPEIGYVIDTQTAYKAFKAPVLKKILKGGLVERAFAFDLELMLKTELNRAASLENVGIAWIDSEAESTSDSGEAYVQLLQMIATIYRAYLPREEWRESFAKFLDQMDCAKFDKLLDNCPPGIATKDAKDFVPSYKAVTADDLLKAIR